MDYKNEKIIITIYEKIFKNINEDYIDVFLCGGASNSKEQSDRDKVMEQLKPFENIRVHYPEDLFMEILKTDKTQDLMSLEHLLAANSDYICIICESAGSLVELGAFVNNTETIGKVIAVFDERRKKEESFIMLGPAAYLHKNKKYKENVVFYNKDNIESLVSKLRGIFGGSRYKNRRQFKRSYTYNNRPLNSFIGQYYFILLILFFYKTLSSKDIANIIKHLYKEYSIEDEKKFDIIFQPSIKLLQKHKLLNKHITKKEDQRLSKYTLTEKGYDHVNHLLSNLSIENRTSLYDKVSFDIMLNKYYT